jgi:hypothetical protein
LLNIAIRPYRVYLPRRGDRYGDVPVTPLTTLAKVVAIGALAPHPSARHHMTVKGLQLLYATGRLSSQISPITATDVTGFGPMGSRETGALDLGTQTAVELLTVTPNILLSGWQLRSWPLLAKHRQVVLARMQLTAPDIDRVHRDLRTCRANCDLLIGVHVRQGDYALWASGRYFFEASTYANWMRAVAERFANRGRVGFVVCSDQPQPPEAFMGLKAYLNNDRTEAGAIRDIIRLSRCDLLMLPPSTFGSWASFIGNVPILPLRSKDADVTREPILDKGIFAAALDPDLANTIG